MQVIDITAVASQTLSVALGGQAVQINLYQLGVGGAAAIYMDLVSNGAQILTGRKCKAYGNLPNTRAPFMLTGRRYLGFQGDFLWTDTQASATNPTQPPQASGLGTRWQLTYLSESDLEGAGLVAG